MAKKSKQQRRCERAKNAERRLRVQLADLDKLHAMQGRALQDTQRALAQAQAERDRIMRAVKDVCLYSAALPEKKRAHFHQHLRVPISGRPSIYHPMQMMEVSKSIECEEMATLVMYDVDLQQAMAKHIHLDIIDAPGGGTLRAGYAVSHTVLRSMRDPQYLVEIIVREFGHKIWEALKR
jgi:hypothetical protein